MNEIGIIKAIAIGGPRPGIAPIMRPTTMPIIMAPRLAKEITSPKNEKASMLYFLITLKETLNSSNLNEEPFGQIRIQTD